MATNYCQYCGSRISPNVVYCPNCRRKLRNTNEPYKRPRTNPRTNPSSNARRNKNKKDDQSSSVAAIFIVFIVVAALCLVLGLSLLTATSGIVVRKPTPAPSFTPRVTVAPTEEVTPEPTEEPTEEPTKKPTSTPTKKPSENKTYNNGRYGYSLKYPTDVLSQSSQAGNGDGAVFTGNKITVTVSGSNNVFHEDIDELYAEAQARGGVSYKNKKSNYFIVSGTTGNTIYYTKTYVGRESINTLTIEYPTSMKKQYDSTVTTVANSFTPGDLSNTH